MGGGLTRLEADIDFIGMESPYKEKTLYFEIADENADMLADDSYDAFVLVPLFVAMYHKQDLHICGNISRKLYQNIKWYIPRIFCDFSKALTLINLTVDGFTSTKPKGTLTGASLSCGVDSFSTIYDHFIREDDPNYRINALFHFNHEMRTHKKILDNQDFFDKSFEGNRLAADSMNLPMYSLETNLYAFNTKMKDLRGKYFSIAHLSLSSCVLSLSNAICRYYMPATFDYQQAKVFNKFAHKDIAEFSESYLIPLIQTENLELIPDGCQYRRTDKVKNIVNWEISQKYLHPCNTYTSNGLNCSVCPKCLRTLLPLEILGKLDNFSGVFDIEKYKTISDKYKLRCLKNYGKEPFETESVDFAKENNFPMPALNKPATAVKKKPVAVVKKK